MVAVATPGLARISDRHEGTPRAALFRRAIVETAECTARARRHGEAPRFPRLRAGRQWWRIHATCEMGSPSEHPLSKRSRSQCPTQHQRPDAEPCHVANTGISRPGSCPYFRPPRKRAALRCFGAPSWTSRAIRHMRGDLGPLFASPTVRLRLPPSGEHAAAPGSAALLASPRRRACRCRTSQAAEPKFSRSASSGLSLTECHFVFAHEKRTVL